MKTAFLLVLCSLSALSQENGAYVIASGDSAATISQKFQISTNELLANNPGLDFTRLWVGARVRISSPTNAANLANGLTFGNQSNSFVDASRLGMTVTTNDTSFFERIKKAVLANDIEWLSGAVSYPFVLRRSAGDILLRNRADFGKHSASILTPHLKSEVRNQSPASLFKNWQGLMIGNGVIWFSPVQEKAGEDWKYRIIGINPEDRWSPK